MNDTTKGEPLALETYKAVLKHLKKKRKKKFRHITNAGQYFQDAMYIYMADFMDNELVPYTYDYTKLFGLWKGKGSKLDLNRYITSKIFGRTISRSPGIRKNERAHNIKLS